MGKNSTHPKNQQSYEQYYKPLPIFIIFNSIKEVISERPSVKEQVKPSMKEQVKRSVKEINGSTLVYTLSQVIMKA